MANAIGEIQQKNKQNIPRIVDMINDRETLKNSFLIVFPHEILLSLQL